MRTSFRRTVSTIAVLALTSLFAVGPVSEAVAEPPGEEASTQKTTVEPGGTGEARETCPLAEESDKVAADRLQRLQSRLDGLLADGISQSAKVGVRAVDARTGQVLYDNNGGTGFNPASNMKLLTSATALDVFGPSKTFKTRLLASEPEKGVVDGPLYVQGKGEPFLLFEDFIHWASQLKLKGIDKIKGDIVVDDSIFAGEYLPPAFGQKDEDASYRAPIGAVSVNFNAVSVIVTPARHSGGRPKIRMYPPNDHVTIDNEARTVVGPGQQLDFSSEPTDDGGTRIRVGGLIGTRSSEVRSRLRIDNPPGYAGSVLQKALSMVGVEVKGGVRTGEVPKKADVVVSHQSQPLSYVILAMNKWSNNFMAEQLLRRLGVGSEEESDKKTPSSWGSSREKVLAFLEQAGLDPEQVDIKNGSGLYDGNSVSPRQFTTVLRYMLDHRAAPEYLTSLAVAGKDGTLGDRMEGELTAGMVRAKTGTLAHVSALSGYVTTESGRRVVFSILFNETPRKGWTYRRLQDRIVRALAGL